MCDVRGCTVDGLGGWCDLAISGDQEAWLAKHPDAQARVYREARNKKRTRQADRQRSDQQGGRACPARTRKRFWQRSSTPARVSLKATSALRWFFGAAACPSARVRTVGRHDTVGSLAPGKRADLVAVALDPHGPADPLIDVLESTHRSRVVPNPVVTVESVPGPVARCPLSRG